MAHDIGFRLKSHFLRLLTNNMKDEVSYRLESVWASHFDDLVVAQDNAAKNQQQVFVRAKKAQSDYQRQVERAYAVFNFFCGHALGWFGAHLQSRVGTSYFQVAHEGLATERNFTPQAEEGSKATKKLFGDVGKDISDAVTKFTLSGIKGPKAATVPDGKGLVNSPSLEELRRGLKREIVKQKDAALGAIDEIGNQIGNSSDFGDRLLAALQSQYPEMKTASPKVQEEKGMERINHWLNQKRVEWAVSWPYYGYDPPKKNDWLLQRSMEKELWVLWVAENRKMIWHSLTDIIAERMPWFETVVDHMHTLNIPVTEVITRRGKNREPQIDRLIIWAVKRKPEQVMPTGLGEKRTLTPIEHWARPH